MRVPRIKASVVKAPMYDNDDSPVPMEFRPEYQPYPRGTYRCRIVEFAEPKEMRSRPIYHLRIKVQPIDYLDRPAVNIYVAGYLPAIMMIYRARQHWIDEVVNVRIGLREYDGRIYNDGYFLWDREPLT